MTDDKERRAFYCGLSWGFNIGIVAAVVAFVVSGLLLGVL